MSLPSMVLAFIFFAAYILVCLWAAIAPRGLWRALNGRVYWHRRGAEPSSAVFMRMRIVGIVAALMGVVGIPLAVVWAMVTNAVTNGEGYKQMGAQS
ncbi:MULTISPECIES: hypothetical protein [Dermabacter]|uniref:hypothetical protein n=1 Tax=Dermabacter TaxID=36739 RepID=UPI000F8896A6|nr:MULTISPECIES: hypothetical protein [Dermabacter]MCG7444002.1 hypothetical protein [Dermabacter vaginalis]